MEVLILAQSYDCYGGCAIYSVVGDLLTTRLGDYGSAVNSIHLTAHLSSQIRNPRRTLEELFDQFHDALKKLPKVTFRRQLRRIEIEFLSPHFHASDHEYLKPSVEKSNLAAGEVATALELVRTRLKRADDFDVEQFLKDAKGILKQGFGSAEEIEAIETLAKQRSQLLEAAKGPWEKLDIDWSLFHPAARQILDDPFFWENANDCAPHGDDTGADLLEDFRRWNKRNGIKSPLLFRNRLLADLGIAPIDWNITQPGQVLQLERDRPIPFSVCNQVAIGLAFAVVKLRANCPDDVLQPALQALQRTAISIDNSKLEAPLKEEWNQAITRMRTKLQSLPR